MGEAGEAAAKEGMAWDVPGMQMVSHEVEVRVGLHQEGRTREGEKEEREVGVGAEAVESRRAGRVEVYFSIWTALGCIAAHAAWTKVSGRLLSS